MSVIYTHAGKAHADEVLAAAILMAHFPDIEAVQRLSRAARKNFQKRPEDWVVDIGEVYDPENRQLDHHQQDNKIPVCSVTLALREVYPDLVPGKDLSKSRKGEYDAELRKTLMWLSRVELWDTSGPRGFAEKYEVTTQEIISKQVNPIGQIFTGVFAEFPNIRRRTAMGAVLVRMGKSVLKTLSSEARCMQWLDDNARVVETPVANFVIIPPLDDFEIQKVRVRWAKRRAGPSKLAAIVSLTHSGLTHFFHVERHPAVDLHKLRGRDDLEFLHDEGFSAAIRSTDPEELKSVMRLITS